MSFREITFLIGAGCILLFFIVLSILISVKPGYEINLEDIVNGKTVMTKRDMKRDFKAKISESSFYQKRCEDLQKLLNLSYNTEETPETIMKFELMALICGLGITLLIHIIFNFLLITVIAFALSIYAVFMKQLSLKAKIKEKENGFDNALPQFETNMLLGMQAGAGLQKSMGMAIKTLPEGLVQVEFKKLLLETKTYTDDIALPYLNLSKRVPTKDCERFCNIVISGVKNGNSMSDILNNESEYMTQQVLNKIKELGEKNAVKATAISSGLVFLPLLVVFLAPMMASSM